MTLTTHAVQDTLSDGKVNVTAIVAGQDETHEHLLVLDYLRGTTYFVKRPAPPKVVASAPVVTAPTPIAKAPEEV